MKRWLFLPASLVAAGLAGGCWWLRPAEGPGPSPSPVVRVQSSVPVAMRPLPGGLDDRLMFDSNSPEIVQSPGILLAVRPYPDPEHAGAYQNGSFQGDFVVFSHHIAKDEHGGDRLLTLGLVASNPGDRPVTVTLTRGSSYLSQPDAPFRVLPGLVSDPEGKVWAGPGDRVETDALHGHSTMAGAATTIPPGGDALLYNLPIPTSVAIPPPINGRTTLIEAHADRPIGLAEVAVFPDREGGGFKPTTLADFQAELARLRPAGPREQPATPFERDKPAPKGTFRLGRVAGVARGAGWDGGAFADRTTLPGPGERVGFPIASTYLNRLGTHQDQSAELETRYGDTAYEAHGNYGVTYTLRLHLANPDATPRTYALSLSHPLQVVGKGEHARAVFLAPPNPAVTFRGPISLSWQDPGGTRQERFMHVVLHQGEAGNPFATLVVPPGGLTDATVKLGYPADATPPQLLTVERS